MVLISLGFTIAAAAMGGVAAGMSADHGSILATGMVRAGAAAVTILAGVCWLEVRRDRQRERRDGERARIADEYRRREAALIRMISSRADAPTGPLRQLRSVR